MERDIVMAIVLINILMSIWNLCDANVRLTVVIQEFIAQGCHVMCVTGTTKRTVAHYCAPTEH